MEVGDIVRVKSYMKQGSTDILYYDSNMDRYKGKTFKIISARNFSGMILIRLGSIEEENNFNLGKWNWLEKWLEPVSARLPVEELL